MTIRTIKPIVSADMSMTEDQKKFIMLRLAQYRIGRTIACYSKDVLKLSYAFELRGPSPSSHLLSGTLAHRSLAAAEQDREHVFLSLDSAVVSVHYKGRNVAGMELPSFAISPKH